MSEFRSATVADSDALLDILEPVQRAHEARHPIDADRSPQGWREATREKIARWLEREGTISLVATGEDGSIEGFVIAPLYQAPPVYAPGGPVCFEEAFAVSTMVEDADALRGRLIDALVAAAREAGAVFVKIVVSEGDPVLLPLLAPRGFTPASEWYRSQTPVAPIPESSSAMAGVRAATAADVPRILELGEIKRLQYQEYQSVMWRKSDLPRETFAPRVTSQVEDPATIALVHEDAGGIVDGYVITQRGYIDDYMVAPPERWEAVGGALLVESSRRSEALGEERLIVVCGEGDGPKRTALAVHGLELCFTWYVLNL